MSIALQIALFLASVAIVVMVAFLIPIFLKLRKHCETAARQLEELKADVKLLVNESRMMIEDVHDLSSRAHKQLDEVEKVLRTVGAWSERADRIVHEIGAVVEPPILTAARNIHIFRKGLAMFLDRFFHRNHTPKEKDEAAHGRD